MASVLNRRSGGVARMEDVTCGICLSILVEPVTMPCFHELCMPCFEQQVRQTSLHCPMCRVRIGSWARKAARENRLIDEKRWHFIRQMFPAQVRRRLAGVDEASPGKSASSTKPQLDLAKPGEIRKEFEEQLRLYEEERQRQQRREEEESVKLIRLLQAQSEKSFQAKADSRKSLRIASKSHADPTGARWKRIVHVPDTPNAASPHSPIPSTSRASRSPSVESEDSIARELQHFKPILAAPKTPPKNPSALQIRRPRFVTAAPRSLTAELDAVPCPNPVLTRSLAILESERWHRVARVTTGSGQEPEEAKTPPKRGSEDGAQEVEPKRRCRGRPKSTNVVPNGGKENERRVSTRKREEDDDKVYACKLQQYYNMCGRSCVASPYQLRSRAK